MKSIFNIIKLNFFNKYKYILFGNKKFKYFIIIFKNFDYIIEKF